MAAARSGRRQHRSAGACLRWAQRVAFEEETSRKTTGFAELVEVLADPDHEEHEGMRTWAGEGYDPEHFDLEAVNESLSFVTARPLR